MPGPPTLVIAIMPLPSDDIQREFKHWGDVTMGIPTQIVQFAKVAGRVVRTWIQVVCCYC